MLAVYKIYQNELKGYDTYDSAIVVSESEEKARLIHPSGIPTAWGKDYGSWVSSRYDVFVEYLGELITDDYEEGDVILASFNAG